MCIAHIVAAAANVTCIVNQRKEFVCSKSPLPCCAHKKCLAVISLPIKAADALKGQSNFAVVSFLVFTHCQTLPVHSFKLLLCWLPFLSASSAKHYLYTTSGCCCASFPSCFHSLPNTTCTLLQAAAVLVSPCAFSLFVQWHWRLATKTSLNRTRCVRVTTAHQLTATLACSS